MVPAGAPVGLLCDSEKDIADVLRGIEEHGVADASYDNEFIWQAYLKKSSLQEGRKCESCM